MIRITAREMVRHALYVSSLSPLLMHRRAARGLAMDHLNEPNRRRVFGHIYEHGGWQMGNTKAVHSGPGSELAATDTIRARLPELFAQLGASSVVDVGCGDFTWMQHVDMPGIDYTGVDIVPPVIEANEKHFGTVTRSFLCIDAVTEDIPRADVVLCREVLFHLSFEDGLRLLEQIRRSDARALIATSDTSTSFNSNIRTGDFRVVNLRKRPYHLARPNVWIADEAVAAGRGLGVWTLR